MVKSTSELMQTSLKHKKTINFRNYAALLYRLNRFLASINYWLYRVLARFVEDPATHHVMCGTRIPKVRVVSGSFSDPITTWGIIVGIEAKGSFRPA